jgi:hypothetical protein
MTASPQKAEGPAGAEPFRRRNFTKQPLTGQLAARIATASGPRKPCAAAVMVVKIARRKLERSALAPIDPFINSSFVPLGVAVAKLIERLMRDADAQAGRYSETPLPGGERAPSSWSKIPGNGSKGGRI